MKNSGPSDVGSAGPADDTDPITADSRTMTARHLTRDERGVSPVVGVILMIAITVLLASVIGTFVLGFGDGLREGTPQVAFAVTETDADTDAVTVRKTGGEPLESDDLRVVVNGTSLSEAAPSGFGSGEWATGESYTFDGDAGSGEFDLSDGDEVRVAIVWEPTGGLLFERTVSV